jgi:hypothetical protein
VAATAGTAAMKLGVTSARLKSRWIVVVTAVLVVTGVPVGFLLLRHQTAQSFALSPVIIKDTEGDEARNSHVANDLTDLTNIQTLNRRH